MRLPALTPPLKFFRRRTPQRRRKGQGARSGPVTLGRPRIFILPTRQGVLFALILLTMLLGSINYSNSLGFALTFLLAGMSFLAILHTYRNLAGLEFSAGRSAPVFTGDTALFSIIVHNPSARARYALLLQLDQQPVLVRTVPPQGTQGINLAHPATQRGWLSLGRLTASTRFPLGLFCAWSYLQVEARCLVYPAPRGGPALGVTAHDGMGGHAQSAGDEDFAGQRNYRAGDVLTRVNWKAAARGQGLLVKEFAGGTTGIVWLDWEALPGLATEARLGRLCQAVLDAAADGALYGLRLPGQRIGPATGERHMHACLSALALFPGTH